MRRIVLDVQHDKGRQQATDRLRSLAQMAEGQFRHQVTEITQTWHDDGRVDFSIRAMGMTVAGQMLVSDDNVRIEAKLPLMAMPFRSRMEDALRDAISDALS
jgi:hypothetical protein